MPITHRWIKEPGPRIIGSCPLDSAKLQAPGIVPKPGGGYRLFYTAVGPGKPFDVCQGYILRAVSDDGVAFSKEPGIRLAPQPDVPHFSLRGLAPSVTLIEDGRWRMYFEARGPADIATSICSAVSDDLLNWELEDGIRFVSDGNVGGPRYLPLGDGRARLFCFDKEVGPGGRASSELISNSVISAITSDGLNFEREPGYRKRDQQSELDSAGITAAQVIPPEAEGEPWTMVYSAWQDVPPGTVVPVHPSQDADAIASGRSADFAAASIAADMAGYRSRIFIAHSDDGLTFGPGQCAIEGGGYDADEIDAVHAEDMSVIRIGEGRYRMYYAACDSVPNWCIASAVSSDDPS